MLVEVNAVVLKDERWFAAFCPEIVGANGQGKNFEKCVRHLDSAINFMVDTNLRDYVEQYGEVKVKTVLL